MIISYSLLIIGFTLAGIGFPINDAHGAGFIKFDGIDGEATDKDHKGWSDLLSLSENLATSVDTVSARSGYDISDEIIVVKYLDSAGPHLAESIATGKVFPKVLINLCTEVEPYCYLSYELSNVMITRYSISGSANHIPSEEISLRFEKITREPLTDSQTKDDKTTDEAKEKPIPETTESLEEDLKEDEFTMKPKPKVPAWVQSTAKFWVDRNVSDREFTDALGFLVKERIIDVEIEPQLTDKDEPTDEERQVPAWIAQSTDWWINGQVPEDQFLEGIKWMIKNKIIRGI